MNDLYRFCAGSHSCCEIMTSTVIPWSEDSISTVPSPFFSASMFSVCLPQFCLGLKSSGINIGVPSYPQHFSQSCISQLTAAHSRKKLPSHRPRAALIYEHEQDYLEGTMTECPFSKLIIAGSTSGLVSSPAWDFDQNSLLWSRSHIWSEHSCWPCHGQVTKSLVSTTCLTGQYMV